MKTIILLFLALLTALFPASGLKAQFSGLDKRIEQKLKRRAEKKVDQAIDKAIDKTEKGAEDAVKGNRKNKKESKETSDSNTAHEPSDDTSPKNSNKSFTAYSKFDFIPGEKVIAYEDFSQDAVGDFPAKWNTNSSGEVVTIEGYEGNWLALTSNGVVTPDFINDLPENFTFEFDLLISKNYDFYDSPFFVDLVSLQNSNEFTNWKMYGPNRTGIEISLHPQDAGSAALGKSSYSIFNKGARTMEHSVQGLESFNSKGKNYARVSIWRQGTRLRVYVNESKLWDLPKAFDPAVKYNGIIFMKANSKEENRFFIQDLRLAVGKPDTRHKLVNEGKFVTSGILFDVNSDQIKPESHGILKEIAQVLNENETVKVKITGHTDADGDEKTNLDLSKRRAASVKTALSKDFGISENRLETDGKGESEPIDKNDTSEGKANNRRVEFVKL